MELRREVLALIGDLVDVLNYAPVKCPEIAQLQPAIQGAMGELERLAVALRAKATTDTNKPSVCTQEVDIAAARAADVLDRIAQAGGLAAASKELKDEVVKVWRLMMGLGIRRKNQERCEATCATCSTSCTPRWMRSAAITSFSDAGSRRRSCHTTKSAKIAALSPRVC